MLKTVSGSSALGPALHDRRPIPGRQRFADFQVDGGDPLSPFHTPERMRGGDADGFALAFELEVVNLATRMAECAGNQAAFALLQGRARLDGEDFGQTFDTHLRHVEPDRPAYVRVIIFEPSTIAEQQLALRRPKQ